MENKIINAKGSNFLQEAGILIFVFGIIAGIPLIIEGGNSKDDIPLELIVGFAVLFYSFFVFAFVLNIVNINRNLEKILYYKEKENFEKNQKA